jgi:hypothetical protein
VSDYRIPQIPEIEEAYRAAHHALEAIMPESFGFLPEADLYLGSLLSRFPLLVDEAAGKVAVRGSRFDGPFSGAAFVEATGEPGEGTP